jgi:predicted nuclease with TOPRIM domain
MLGLDVLGVVASVATIISGLGWVLDRNSKKFEKIQNSSNVVMRGLTEKVENLDKTLMDVRLTLPEKYVTKEELLMHIRGEETWHNSIDRRLDDIREELSSLREWRHR